MPVRVTKLIMGESNAAGYQGGTVPAQTYVNASRIFRMASDFSIVPASDPLIPGFNFGVGPGMGDADRALALDADTTKQICVIPLIGLKQSDWVLTSNAFTVTIKAILAAETNWGPIISASLTQGINDTNVYSDALYWAARVRDLIRNTRIYAPGVPFVVNSLPANPNTPGTDSYKAWDVIQTAIGALPFDVPNLAVVNATDLPVNGSTYETPADTHHWTAPAMHTIGNRDADALATL